MSDIPVLSLIQRGCPEHPRFLIADQRKRVWTGQGWSYQEDDGLLFCNDQDAGRECVEILSDSTSGKPVFRFVAPVEVEVRSDKPPDLAALKLWLMRAARLYVDYKQPGLPEGAVILTIDWSEMSAIEE